LAELENVPCLDPTALDEHADLLAHPIESQELLRRHPRPCIALRNITEQSARHQPRGLPCPGEGGQADRLSLRPQGPEVDVGREILATRIAERIPVYTVGPVAGECPIATHAGVEQTMALESIVERDQKSGLQARGEAAGIEQMRICAASCWF